MSCRSPSARRRVSTGHGEYGATHGIERAWAHRTSLGTKLLRRGEKRRMGDVGGGRDGGVHVAEMGAFHRSLKPVIRQETCIKRSRDAAYVDK
jgi:hypothetical protein